MSITVGYYDDNDVFFTLYYSRNPEQQYSYACSGYPVQYIQRIGQHEVKLTSEQAEALILYYQEHLNG